MFASSTSGDNSVGGDGGSSGGGGGGGGGGDVSGSASAVAVSNGHSGGAAAAKDEPIRTILTPYQIDAMYEKIQWKLVPFLMTLYFLAFLDRANVGNAHDDLTHDLDMTESQYTNAAAIFFLGYTVAEVPANLAMTKVPAGLWIGCLMMIWGSLAAAMAAIRTYTHLLVVRTILGLFEGGFFPGAVFYLTTWFPPERIARPIALFHSASAIAGCIGGLLAYGILQMDGLRGMRGWQWLFLLEGLPTIIIGFTVYFVLPVRPEDCKWLDEDEKRYLIANLHRSVKDVHSYNLSWAEVRDTLISPKLISIALISFFMLVPVYSTAFYMPTQIRDFGFTTLQANALTTPVYAVAIATSLINSWHSDKTKERYYHVMIPTFGTAFFFGLQAIAMRYEIRAFEYTVLFFTTGLTWASVGPFWGWVSSLLKSRTASAVGIAWVGALAHPAAYLGPKLYAIAKESPEQSYWPAMIGMTLALLIAGFGILGWMLSPWYEVPVAPRRYDEAVDGAAAVEESKGLLPSRDGDSKQA